MCLEREKSHLVTTAFHTLVQFSVNGHRSLSSYTLESRFTKLQMTMLVQVHVWPVPLHCVPRWPSHPTTLARTMGQF